MRLFRVAQLLLAVPMLAFASAPVTAQKLDEYKLVMPPARYASGPLRYPVTIHRLPNARMRHVCVNVVPTKGAYAAPELGCSIVGPVKCDIYLPKRRTIPKALSEHIVLHELAHCRGWAGDHPD